MRRRAFCFVLGTFFLTTFHLAQAQQPTKIARIGYLSGGDPVSRGYRIEAFRQGLKELGYIEGKNIIIEYRFAEARSERLPELARELIGLKVDIIFAGGTPARRPLRTLRDASIVRAVTIPLAVGLFAGLPRPGGNITGLTNLAVQLVGKRLELLKEVIPRLSRVALLCNPSNPRSDLGMRETEVVAQSVGVQLHVAEVQDRDDLERAFAALKRDRAEALITLRTPLIVNDLAKPIIHLADKSRLPAIYDDRIFPQLGGLMSYGKLNLA
jgi:putative ABC transport system substrate-binding protein